MSKTIDRKCLFEIIEKVIEYAIKKDYSGYCKHDALNSPILRALSLNNKWLRLIFIQAIMRFPINFRPLLFTERSRNPKGIAIFIRAYLLFYKTTKQEQYKTCAEELLQWLIENHSNKDGRYHGYCWGYNFPWQSPFFYAPKYYPNLTVTVFTGEAFILAYRVLNNVKYFTIAQGAADFLLNDLPVLEETEDSKCLGYIPGRVQEKVINVNAMTAAFLSKLYYDTKNQLYRENAIKLINFVVNQAIGNNRWNYTVDPKSYVDNYHTGGIIDGLLETMENLDYWKWEEILLKAAGYYKDNLFTPDGAPRNRDNKEYPYDIHGSAQGVITFAKMSRIDKTFLELAETIYGWTTKYLYSGKGYFYYQKSRYFIKKFTFMRWCNAWMLYAMAELLFAGEKK